MSKMDPLLELIQSLTAQEKRYFKVFTKGKATEGDKLYVTLFDYIDKYNSCDPKILSKHGKSPKLFQNFASHKNSLYSHILSALHSYHTTNNQYLRLLELLADIHILMEKKLYGQAEKRLKSAKKIAQKFHFDTILIRLQLLERTIIRGHREKKSFEILLDTQEESRNTLEQLVNRVKVMDLYDKVYLVSRNQSIQDQYLDEVSMELEKKKEMLEALELSFTGKMTYHLLFATYYQMFGSELDDSMFHVKALIEHYESNATLLKEQMERYINLLNNYLNFHYLKQDFDAFPEVIQKLRNLKPKSGSTQIKLFHTIYHLEMVRLLRTQQYEKALAIIPEIEQGLQTYHDKIPRLNALLLKQNLAIAYFHSAKFKASLRWINIILNESKQEIRQDVSIFCRLLKLIIYFIQEEFDLMESVAQSLIRLTHYTDKPGANLVLANQIARMFQKALRVTPDQQTEVLSDLYQELLASNGLINGKEEILLWLERRLPSVSSSLEEFSRHSGLP